MLNGSGTNDFATSPLGEYHKTRIKREILISNDAHNKIVEAGIGHTKQMVIAGITFASLGRERDSGVISQRYHQVKILIDHSVRLQDAAYPLQVKQSKTIKYLNR